MSYYKQIVVLLWSNREHCVNTSKNQNILFCCEKQVDHHHLLMIHSRTFIQRTSIMNWKPRDGQRHQLTIEFSIAGMKTRQRGVKVLWIKNTRIRPGRAKRGSDIGY